MPGQPDAAPRAESPWAGVRRGLWTGLAVAAVALPLQHQWRQHRLAGAWATAAEQSSAPALALAPMRLRWEGEAASASAKQLAEWVAATHDNGGRDFVIVDKRNAKVFVFAAQGDLRGATPVLLGSKVGDDSVPGIGQRPIAEVSPQERTTPAGRFLGQRGMNALNQDVVWVDYGAAVSMHRVRTTDPAERRLERLASPTSADNRISYGCINMPVAFFEQVLAPIFARQRAVIYVLPEVKSLHAVFGIPDDPAGPPVTAPSALEASRRTPKG